MVFVSHIALMLSSNSNIEMYARMFEIAKPCGIPFFLSFRLIAVLGESEATVTVSIAAFISCNIGASILVSNLAYNVFKWMLSKNPFMSVLKK